MKTYLFEARHGPDALGNWGKFMVGIPDTEWDHPTGMYGDGGVSLLDACGWPRGTIWVFDLQTGEAAFVNPRGWARADLQKHAIKVCPLFESWLEWLYEQDLSLIDDLPRVIDLPAAPFALDRPRLPGKPAAPAVTPGLPEILAYMNATGWETFTTAAAGQLWHRPGRLYGVLMLPEGEAGKAACRVLIRRLAEAEDRDAAEVTADIAAPRTVPGPAAARAGATALRAYMTGAGWAPDLEGGTGTLWRRAGHPSVVAVLPDVEPGSLHYQDIIRRVARAENRRPGDVEADIAAAQLLT